MYKGRLVIVNILLLIALAGSYWGRHIDDAVIRQGNFLTSMTLPFQGWSTSDVPLSAADLSELQPDSYLVRNYGAANGDQVQLAVIAGHRKKSIHTPAFCMAGGGWETLSEQTATLHLPGRSIETDRELMDQNGTRILVTYFFTDGTYCSPSLTTFQTVQLLKRFRTRIPMGALVRVIVPVRTSPERAEALTGEFASATIPQIMAALHRAQFDIR
jgi:EpsI family protein